MLKNILFILFVSTSAFLSADMPRGERLERQMWEDMKAHNWSAVDNHISSYFQSVHADGNRTRAQELALIKSLNIGNYTIHDIKVTEGPDSMIVTYMISVTETIDNSKISPKPTPRLSVWQKNQDRWEWSAHANLSPISGLK